MTAPNGIRSALEAMARQGATELAQAMYQGHAFAPNEPGMPGTLSSREVYEARHGDMNEGLYQDEPPSLAELTSGPAMEQQMERQIEP